MLQKVAYLHHYPAQRGAGAAPVLSRENKSRNRRRVNACRFFVRYLVLQFWMKGRIAMIKAVVTNEVIVPQERLPEDWLEGTGVAVEKFSSAAADKNLHPTDAWMDDVEALARTGNPEDDRQLDAAIQDARRRETATGDVIALAKEGTTCPN
jgi:hypothetical protein